MPFCCPAGLSFPVPMLTTPRMTIPAPDNLRTELKPAANTSSQPVPVHPQPFPLAGGWLNTEFTIGHHSWNLTLPCHPDSLLDDPSVVAASQQDDRMPYWAWLWPSAIPMAQAILRSTWDPAWPILELGCGSGFISLAALQRGHRVTITDYEPHAVALAHFNALRNGFRHFESRLLDWRKPEPQTFPLILGCDLLYQQSSHQPLLTLLRRMLVPGGICWIADAGRDITREFWLLAMKQGFPVQLIQADGSPREEPGSDFQIFVLQHPETRIS